MVRLDTSDHPRYQGELRYIYPVVSRRAEGVSIGINLNPNDACNWRCVYCQVPNLQRGKGPAIDLARLEGELEAMLHDLLEGDFMETRVPEGSRRLNDVAFSGNGEPTSSPDFAEAVELVGRVLESRGLVGKLKLVLITNGSLMHKPTVQAALTRFAQLGGEVWFKLDGASDETLARFNHSARGFTAHLENLRTAAALAPTFVQTAVFRFDGDEPMAGEFELYCQHLAALIESHVPLRGVHLYSLARESHQPEATRLGRLTEDELDTLAEKLRALGLTVTANA
jgi:wyosine [tRNA(Phe)-imidazoG37] synthetase (radical SAM superfamily)